MNINNLSLTEKIELVAIGKLSRLDLMLSIKDLSQTDKALLIDEVDDMIVFLKSGKQLDKYVLYTEHNIKDHKPLIIELFEKHDKKLPITKYEQFPNIDSLPEVKSILLKDYEDMGYQARKRYNTVEKYNPKFIDVYDDHELIHQPIQNLNRLKEVIIGIDKNDSPLVLVNEKTKRELNEEFIEHKNIFKNTNIRTKVKAYLKDSLDKKNIYQECSKLWSYLRNEKKIEKGYKARDFLGFLMSSLEESKKNHLEKQYMKRNSFNTISKKNKDRYAKVQSHFED